MTEHSCELPDVDVWLFSEGGEVPAICPDCGTYWYPAYGWGSGDSSGWTRGRP